MYVQCITPTPSISPNRVDNKPASSMLRVVDMQSLAITKARALHPYPHTAKRTLLQRQHRVEKAPYCAFFREMLIMHFPLVLHEPVITHKTYRSDVAMYYAPIKMLGWLACDVRCWCGQRCNKPFFRLAVRDSRSNMLIISYQAIPTQ